jgi:hypothetical protein
MLIRCGEMLDGFMHSISGQDEGTIIMVLPLVGNMHENLC